MNDPNWLITVASWEDRFWLGTQRILAEHPIHQVLMFYYREYSDWTAKHRQCMHDHCVSNGIAVDRVELSFADSADSWKQVHEKTYGTVDERNPVVDITTMPRDVLWSVLWLLKQSEATVRYVYHRPKSYNREWLSRDPGRPRLVYKLSGIATLGLPTCLVITTGFDPERTRQLMWFYEPRRIFLGFQMGDQFHNQELNVARHRKALKDEYREFDVEEFWIDAYSEDHGEARLTEIILEQRDAHNIIMSSLGPKLGAVAILRTHLSYPETALSYTPSGEFNHEYSSELGDTIRGEC